MDKYLTVDQLTVSDCQTFGRMLESVEKASSIIAMYTEVETRLLIRVSALTRQLSASLIKLYVAVMQFLANAYDYYNRSTIRKEKPSWGNWCGC